MPHNNGMTMGSNDKPEQIDLGLADLLAARGSGRAAELSSSQAERGAEQRPVAARADGGSGNREQQQGEISPLQRLAREGKWSDLVRSAEALLAHGDGGSAEARVWWVRGHLALLSMPASFLAAPLEALCRKLAGAGKLSSELSEALRETAPLLVRRLEDVAEHELAESLRAALERLSLLSPDSAQVAQRMRKKSDAQMRSVAEQGFVLSDAAEGQGSQVGADIAAAAPGGAKLRAGEEVSAHVYPGLSVRRVLALLLFLLVLPIVAWFSFGAGSALLRVAHVESASEGFISGVGGAFGGDESGAAQQVIPVMETRDNVGSLGALFYSIGASPASDGTDMQRPAPERSAGAAPNAATTRGELPAGSAKQQTGRERVNISGPIEGPEFTKGIEAPRGSADGVAGAGAGGAPVRAELPTVNGSAALQSDRPAVDIARPGRAVRTTSVYAAARYSSEVLGRLESGDRVMIEGDSGTWLRLRSRKGRGGYVRRDDVEELPG